MNFRSIIVLIFLILISITIISCSEDNCYEDIEFTIVSTKQINSQIAQIRYTVENTGTIPIHGWKVFFSVHLERGPQLTASESTYYILDPAEISPVRKINVRIPEYYENVRSASVKHFETW